MKKILIATDFSKAADNATLYGVQLASVFNAEVILLNAYENMPAPVSELPVAITAGEMAMHEQRELSDTARLLKARYEVQISTCVKNGTAVHAILEAVQEQHADLLVVGMKSTGKEQKRFLGCTVTALIRKTHVPLLVIPEDANFLHLTKLALAVESDLPASASPYLLDGLKDLAARFDSKLYLVHVAPTIAERALESLHRPLNIKKRLATIDTQYESIYGENFYDGIKDFIGRNRISLLAMMPHHHTLLDRWFIGSTTRTMAFETEIPLLILPEKQ